MKFDRSPTSGSVLDLDERPGSGDLVAEESLLPFVNDPGRPQRRSSGSRSFTSETTNRSRADTTRRCCPCSRPAPEQQFAFEVDLDRCSGCKACVAACHALNGLDDGEAWRDGRPAHRRDRRVCRCCST